MADIPPPILSACPRLRTVLGEAFPVYDEDAAAACRAHWDQKTKPPGSLGRLEEVVSWLCGVRGNTEIALEKCVLHVYAGSHGVADAGVSAYPSDINVMMLSNFKTGGAAINAICRTYGIAFEVYDVGVLRPTNNIAEDEAMSPDVFAECFSLGWQSVPKDAQLFAVGDMGIGNTTVSTAMLAAQLGFSAKDYAGPGTGVSQEQLQHKIQVIEAALERHRDFSASPWELARCLGGKEITAMTAAILRATSLRIPVVLDGLIAAAAASVAIAIQPKVKALCIAGHRSAEPAHALALEHYGWRALLDLDMRLGEGTGAAMAIGVIRAAASAFRDMQTF